MADLFENRASGLESPAHSGADITPSDSSNLSTTSRALWVGGSGDLRVTMAGGQTVTLRNAPTGMCPIRVIRVHATGTTATGLVAVW